MFEHGIPSHILARGITITALLIVFSSECIFIRHDRHTNYCAKQPTVVYKLSAANCYNRLIIILITIRTYLYIRLWLNLVKTYVIVKQIRMRSFHSMFSTNCMKLSFKLVHLGLVFQSTNKIVLISRINFTSKRFCMKENSKLFLGINCIIWRWSNQLLIIVISSRKEIECEMIKNSSIYLQSLIWGYLTALCFMELSFVSWFASISYRGICNVIHYQDNFFNRRRGDIKYIRCMYLFSFTIHNYKI